METVEQPQEAKTDAIPAVDSSGQFGSIGTSFDEIKEVGVKKYAQTSMDKVLNESMPHLREHLIEIFNSPWAFLAASTKIFILSDIEKKKKVLTTAATMNVFILVGSLLLPSHTISAFGATLSLFGMASLYVLVDNMKWLDDKLSTITTVEVAERKLDIKRKAKPQEAKQQEAEPDDVPVVTTPDVVPPDFTGVAQINLKDNLELDSSVTAESEVLDIRSLMSMGATKANSENTEMDLPLGLNTPLVSNTVDQTLDLDLSGLTDDDDVL